MTKRDYSYLVTLKESKRLKRINILVEILAGLSFTLVLVLLYIVLLLIAQ